MKIFKSLIALLCCFLLLTGFTPISAKPIKKEFNLQNVSSTMDELNEFIIVDNNKFVLELPEDVSLSKDLTAIVNALLNTSNVSVKNRNLKIDPKTKTAYEMVSNTDPILNNLSRNGVSILRWVAYTGRTGLSWNWNYVRVYLSGAVFTGVATVGGEIAKSKAIAAAKLAGFTGLRVSVAGYAILGIAATVGASFPQGIYIDLNYFGLATCGIGSFAGGVFGFGVSVPLANLVTLGPGVCGIMFGAQ